MKRRKMTSEEIDKLIEKIEKDEKEKKDTNASVWGTIDRLQKDMKILEKQMIDTTAILNAIWDNPAFNQYRTKVKG